jgi:hypothetical protein
MIGGNPVNYYASTLKNSDGSKFSLNNFVYSSKTVYNGNTVLTLFEGGRNGRKEK